jgi:outer membrane protein TolC
MKWGRSIRWINALMVCGALAGCRSPKTIHYLGEADLQYYKDKTLAVEYSNVDQPTPQEVASSLKPHTLRDRSKDEIWNMSLVEAIQTAVTNNKMIRTRANPQLSQNSPSIYDPALRETGFLFGSRGVEAALADFDANITSTVTWGRNETYANSLALPNFVNQNDTGVFTSQIAKQFANGGTFAVNHNWNYLGTNAPAALFPSSFSGLLQAQYVQPLWAGAGVEYTRIAGPVRSGFGGITGVSQGVSIARINTDISVADFEAAVTLMLKDVEDLYWELYLAYRQYDANERNRLKAHTTWQKVKVLRDLGAKGGGAIDFAQVSENYFETRAQTEVALSDLYVVENQFRRMLGLPVNDGKIIRPADDPIEAEFVVNWESTLLEALSRRIELRRQKWQIKSLELQRIAAENVTNPRLDLVSSYQLNGFGDQLLSQSSVDGVTAAGYNSAYSTMTRGDLTGWNLGLQFSMPIGFRQARAQLHNTELQLIKARATLSAQELDVSHELAEAIQRLEAAYIIAQTQLDRKIASVKRMESYDAIDEAGATAIRRPPNSEGDTLAELDLRLRAQNSNAAAEIAYFGALIAYNKAITEYQWRRGTLLDHDGIQVAEGEWTEAAHQEALRRAWARSYARPNDHLSTEPDEFSSPMPYPKTDLFPSLPPGTEIHSIAPSPASHGGPDSDPHEGSSSLQQVPPDDLPEPK